MSTLWLVEINHGDFEYGSFISGVVWAESADEAEQVIRAGAPLPHGDKTRLEVKPAPTAGIVHEHWENG